MKPWRIGTPRKRTECRRGNVMTGWCGIESAAVKVATPQQQTMFDTEGVG